MDHSITNENDEDGVLSTDSHLSNDGDNFGRNSNRGIVLKKGPWTSAEDAILIDYVKKHGEGNWNAVRKSSGLSRCGKSCRLRWANHLRPDLKKGAFTSEEERLIVKLHAKMGNKWARMAAHLPGRTDNEIKNYWNTRIKRRQRAGLPLYPPELSQEAMPENQQSLGSCGMYGGDEGCHDILQNGYRTSDAVFDSLNFSPYTAEFPDISASGSLINFPQFNSLGPQTVRLQKHAQYPDESMFDYGGGAANVASSYYRDHNYNSENKVFQAFGPCFPYKPDDTEKLFPLGVSQDNSHLIINDFFSASKPYAGAEKFELPSFQYQESGLGVYDTTPESMDSFVQSSIGGTLPSGCPSPRSSGLLESLLYEANAKATSSTISSGDITDSSPLKICPEFKGYLDSASPSSNSTGSCFNEYTPTHTVGSSQIPVQYVKSETNDESWIWWDGERKQVLNQLDCYRPNDAVLGSSWIEQSASFSKHRGSAETYEYTWNNMPTVYHM